MSRQGVFRKKVLAICMLLVLLLVPTRAVAAENMDVEFVPGTTSPILDPDNPDTVIANTDGIITETKGSNGIVFLAVPTLNFGDELGFNPAATRYYLRGPERPFVQVSDLRGVGTGWKLQISAGPMALVDNPSSVFRGARIHMVEGTVNTSNQALKGTAKSPSISNEIVIACDSAATPQVAMDATVNPLGGMPKGRGMGAWIGRWYQEGADGKFDRNAFIANDSSNSKIWLYVPRAQWRPGRFQISINWDLVNV